MTNQEIERIVAAAGRVLLSERKLPNNEEAAARAIAKLSTDYIEGRAVFPVGNLWNPSPLESEGLDGLKKSLKKAAKKVKKVAKKVLKVAAPVAAIAAPILALPAFGIGAATAGAIGAGGALVTAFQQKRPSSSAPANLLQPDPGQMFTYGEPGAAPAMYTAPTYGGGGGGGGGGFGTGVTYSETGEPVPTVFGVPQTYLPWIAGGALLLFALNRSND